MKMREPTPTTRRLRATIPWIGWCIAALATCAAVVLAIALQDRLQIEARLRSSTALLAEHRGAAVKEGRPRLLLTGDSRAAGLGGDPLGPFTIVNRGLSGQSSIELVARIGRDMAQLRPDHAVVIIGVNDLKPGDADERRVRQAAASIMEIMFSIMEPKIARGVVTRVAEL